MYLKSCLALQTYLGEKGAYKINNKASSLIPSLRLFSLNSKINIKKDKKYFLSI